MTAVLYSTLLQEKPSLGFREEHKMLLYLTYISKCKDGRMD